MWEIVVFIAVGVALLVQTYRTYVLKDKLKDSEETVKCKQLLADEHQKTSALLRERLTEATDKVASLKVVIDNQKVEIKHHEQLIEEQAQILEKKKPESTQYPVAPPDLTAKKNFTRDKKGHFVKK